MNALESRREFLQRLGGGLIVLVAIDEMEAQESGGGGRRRGGRQLPQDIGAWIHVGQDGTAMVFTGKTEVGQNTRTSLTQAVADELRMPVSSVRLTMADTDLVPFDAGTFGSLSTPQMAPVLRKAAAAARATLIEIASDKWNVPAAGLQVRDGAVVEAGGSRKAGFGELTLGQKLVQTISSSVTTTPATEWTVAGKPLAKVNGREFVTGEHKYSTDMNLPGMLHGKVLRPAAFGAKLVSLDAAAAEAGGVKVVRDGDFVGVVAAGSRAADRAVAALKAEWKTEPQPSSRVIYDYLKQNAGAEQVVRTAGSVERALAEAPARLSQQYQVAYIAHTPLEPRAAVAQWSGDRLTVWTGTQRPFGVRSELAEAFGTQCVVVGIDSLRDADGQWRVRSHTGDPDRMQALPRRTLDWVVEAQRRGAGEIVLNCMGSDGVRDGYDIEQLRAVRAVCEVPLVASGGAGAPQHFVDAFRDADVDAVLAASVFHSGAVAIPALKSVLHDNGIEVRRG